MCVKPTDRYVECTYVIYTIPLYSSKALRSIVIAYLNLCHIYIVYMYILLESCMSLCLCLVKMCTLLAYHKHLA